MNIRFLTEKLPSQISSQICGTKVGPSYKNGVFVNCTELIELGYENCTEFTGRLPGFDYINFLTIMLWPCLALDILYFTTTRRKNLWPNFLRGYPGLADSLNTLGLDNNKKIYSVGIYKSASIRVFSIIDEIII